MQARNILTNLSPSPARLITLHSGVASQKIWEGQKIGGSTIFDFRRITLFCLEKRLSKHKMTIFSKNLGESMSPLAPPGYAYDSAPCQKFHSKSFTCITTQNLFEI